MRITRIVSLFGLIWATSAATSLTAAEKITAQVGDMHPDFVLPVTAAAGQKPIALSSTRGKKTLFIQFASW